MMLLNYKWKKDQYQMLTIEAHILKESKLKWIIVKMMAIRLKLIININLNKESIKIILILVKNNHLSIKKQLLHQN
jgi:hypothetical protein